VPSVVAPFIDSAEMTGGVGLENGEEEMEGEKKEQESEGGAGVVSSIMDVMTSVDVAPIRGSHNFSPHPERQFMHAHKLMLSKCWWICCEYILWHLLSLSATILDILCLQLFNHQSIVALYSTC